MVLNLIDYPREKSYRVSPHGGLTSSTPSGIPATPAGTMRDLHRLGGAPFLSRASSPFVPDRYSGREA